MSDLVVADVGTATTPASSATANDLVAATKRHLYGSYREERNRLTASLSAVSETASFKYPLGGIQRGACLAIGVEKVYVEEVDAGAKTAVLTRGDFGSTATSHPAETQVHVNPRFATFDVLAALNDELRALPGAGLFQMKTVDLTYSAAQSGYDLAGVTDLLDVYELRWHDYGSTEQWTRLSGWQLSRDMPTADFPSGLGLILTEGVAPGRTIRVRYKAPFTLLADLTDLITSTGLPASAWDIPPLGAAARLVAGTEIKRNFTEGQGDTRRAGEVPPGARANSSKYLLDLRTRRIGEEVAHLTRQYPAVH